MAEEDTGRRRRGALSVIFNRRSIRRYKRTPISDEIVRLILEAGQRAPCIYQSYTVIQITDTKLRSELTRIFDDKLIEEAPVLLLLCIDLLRTSRMFSAITPDHVLTSRDHPIETVESLIELGMFLSNAITAAEILGLGSVILDYPLRTCREVTSLLGLPKGVIPVVFLCVGVPNERPPPRPRLPIGLIYSKDRYAEVRNEDLINHLKEASEKLRLEGYIEKYGGLKGVSYMEYLRDKIRIDKAAMKDINSVSHFLQENGLKI